ncbi:ABC-2 type transport system ATP-binding protein [Curtobacterium sp. 9128]|uniref:ABC transporter ATP-binding protein n=1 Tax=Curtobacterium sp. 9128 TaxID=1793722 RepID=UPI0007D71A7A|nr:ABC transporter ATP-binding protein [Curtobacterium sp. 9128]SBN61614.1 ABC-2 type transport system ATP-binding protein [Curtobacterium sp. 9128]
MEPTLTDTAIAVRSLHRRQGTFALHDVDVTVPAGLVTGLVGPNGAGKTTLVKSILGLVGTDSGSVGLFGTGSPQDAAVRERIGVVLDQVSAAPEWKVGAVGRYAGLLYERWDDRRFRDLLDRYDVPAGNRVGGLSRGQTVKLSLAMALAHDPELLVLDEPSSGLDPVARRELADTIREFVLDPGHTVLFSTHITEELDDLADHLVVLAGGTVAYEGAVDELHERFAVVRGAGPFPEVARPSTIGVRHDASGRWEGLIRSDDTAWFGPDVVIDQATTDDVVVHLAEGTRSTRKEITA